MEKEKKVEDMTQEEKNKAYSNSIIEACSEKRNGYYLLDFDTYIIEDGRIIEIEIPQINLKGDNWELKFNKTTWENTRIWRMEETLNWGKITLSGNPNLEMYNQIYKLIQTKKFNHIVDNIRDNFIELSKLVHQTMIDFELPKEYQNLMDGFNKNTIKRLKEKYNIEEEIIEENGEQYEQ